MKYMVIVWILENKKLVNLKAIFDFIFNIILILFELFMTLICFYQMYNIYLYLGYLFYVVIFILFMLLLFSIKLLSGHISGGIRTIYYLINKKRFLKNGKIVKVKIIDIKYDAYNRYYLKRYVIVKLDNKIIKSTYYLDDKYVIGKNINVIKYKNKYLVLV